MLNVNFSVSVQAKISSFGSLKIIKFWATMKTSSSSHTIMRSRFHLLVFDQSKSTTSCSFCTLSLLTWTRSMSWSKHLCVIVTGLPLLMSQHKLSKITCCIDNISFQPPEIPAFGLHWKKHRLPQYLFLRILTHKRLVLVATCPPSLYRNWCLQTSRIPTFRSVLVDKYHPTLWERDSVHGCALWWQILSHFVRARYVHGCVLWSTKTSLWHYQALGKKYFESWNVAIA